MKITAALTGLFVLAAAIPAGAQANTVETPATPYMACSPWLEKGGDDTGCKVSLAHWTNRIAAETQDNLRNGTGLRIYGSADAPMARNPQPGVPQMMGGLFAVQVENACTGIKNLDVQKATLTEAVLNANTCLDAVYTAVTKEGLDPAEVNGITEVNKAIAAKLMRQPG